MTTKALNKRTGKAFDDTSRSFIDWTDESLIKYAKSCHYSVNVSECYGVGDVTGMIGSMNELTTRGYYIDNEEYLTITKDEDGE